MLAFQGLGLTVLHCISTALRLLCSHFIPRVCSPVHFKSFCMPSLDWEPNYIKNTLPFFVLPLTYASFYYSLVLVQHTPHFTRRSIWTEEFGKPQSMGSQRVRHD